MPRLVKVSEELFRIEHSDIELKILEARREAKKAKNKARVNTLEKLIDYRSVLNDFKRFRT